MKKIFTILVLSLFFVSFAGLDIWDTLEIQETIDVFFSPDNTSPTTVEPSNRISFFDEEYMSVEIVEDNRIQVSGVIKQPYLLLSIEAGEEVLKKDVYKIKPQEFFKKTITLPKTNEKDVQLVMYTNNSHYGDYTSHTSQMLYYTQTDGVWERTIPPTFEENKRIYEEPKSLKKALRSSRNVQSNDPDIIRLAMDITKDFVSDYDKVRAIHDYICDTFYYDTSFIGTGKNYSAKDAIYESRAICAGFANSFAALCRSINIPCVLVSGYAIEQNTLPYMAWDDKNLITKEPNHAWNEVYVDERWIIVDTTWDCQNKIDNDIRTSHDKGYVYFDANLEFFSAQHRIFDYKDI